MKTKNIYWFEELDKHDIDKAGGKGANLGEMTQAGIPVPPGFVVTAQAYFDFLRYNRLDQKFKKLLAGLDPEKTKELNFAASEIQKMILSAKMSPQLADEIKKNYTSLYTHKGQNMFVAVRSSATAEDLPGASFAGQQKTLLNISGAELVVRAVQNCWSSLFEPRAIYYRIVNKFDHMKVGIAVPIQSMIQSVKAGVLFTIDPVTNDKDVVVIDAAYGLGEAVVSGMVTPDRYYIEKNPLKIMHKEISKQPWRIVKERGKSGTKHESIPLEDQGKQKLSDREIIELTTMGRKIEQHYGFPQDTEWAIDEKDKIYFVQARPVTTIKKKVEVTEVDGKKVESASAVAGQKPILKGAAASVGVASGPVKIIQGPEEIDKIETGDVLVAEMTNPSYVPAMHKAIAIITDTGGVTSHAAIVSRELGIPCVVGTGTATHELKTGMVVTVDGASGLIYKGKINIKPKANSQPTTKDQFLYRQEVPVTATKVYVNLAEAELAERVAKQPVDGVGLLRAEFMVAVLGEHPKAMVAAKRSQEYVNALSEGMRKICEAFSPRPVVYRATDFKTNEYRALAGGDKFEPKEENPMIGYRGCYRYIKDPEMFKYELDAIKIVRDKYGLKNLWLMLPFVRTVKELEQCKQLIDESGLERTRDFKLWMMAEVPSNVILIDKFIDVGIDGVSIGSNDLTQLTLGIDRDSQIMASEFDERDEAVIKSIQHIISVCRQKHVTVSVCGQAPSMYPDFTEKLIEAGITSVSVNPDVILEVRRLIASLEQRMLLKKIIK